MHFNYISVNQPMHIACQNHNNVTKRKFLHVSVLTGPQSLSVQLCKTNFQPFYHTQNPVELSQIRQCVIYIRRIYAPKIIKTEVIKRV